MGKYHVYGLGNALVDYEFQVGPEKLRDLGIEKGVMTLINEAREQALFAMFGGSEGKRACGGSAANSLIALAQLGGRGFLSCKVANDDAGDFYYEDIKKHGLITNAAYERDLGTTGKCLAFITPDADRTLNTYLGITQDFSFHEVIEEELLKAEYLYLEGYLVTSPSAQRACQQAVELAQSAGVKTAISFSDPNIVRHFKSALDEVMGERPVDLVFCNQEEALAYTEAAETNEAVEKLKKRAQQFAITRGKEGALIWDGQHIHQVSGRPVKAVDTNGAGDMFAGTFLYGITHGLGAPQAAELAVATSAELVTAFGPRLSDEKTKAVLASFQGK